MKRRWFSLPALVTLVLWLSADKITPPGKPRLLSCGLTSNPGLVRPVQILCGSGGAEIGGDDYGGEVVDTRLKLTLQPNGFYTVNVTSYNGSSGRYRIKVEGREVCQ